MPAPVARLRRDLSRAIRAGHPWVYADALSAPAGLPAGSPLELHDTRGRWLARGLYDPDSPIALRIWTCRQEEPLGPDLVRRRLRSAAALRRAVIDAAETEAFRLAHGEADQLPGLVCDVYADTAVLRLDTAALVPWLDALATMLPELLPGLRRVVLRDPRRRGRAGSEQEAGAPDEAAEPGLRWLRGEPRDRPFFVREAGMELEVDLAHGHKTGLYLDQRENRRLVRRLAAGRRVLNCFAYTGGFSLAAALGGAASVTTVELAGPALEAARRNFARNGIAPEASAYRFVQGDAFAFLAEHDADFDLVIVDPPSMAPSRASRERALAAYRRLNRDALQRTAPGGLLLTASCSSHVGAEDLRRILGEATLASGRSARILAGLGAGPDHPTLPAWPEGDYLHALLAFVS